MNSHTIKTQSLDEIILPLPPVYTSPNTHTDLRGIRYFRAIASGAVITGGGNGSFGEMTLVHCVEHKRPELVPVANFKTDLKFWYWIRKHPRFSIIGALLEAKQPFDGIRRLTEEAGHITAILAQVNTKEEFLKAIYPRLTSLLSVRGHRIRVTNEFKDRFKKRQFTVEDFLQMDNQELRRVMLRVLPLEKILSMMVEVARDEEGTIYAMKESSSFGDPRYLHVKCPSTGQEYLLAIPDHIESPKEARRWTFDLEVDAEFVKEA